MEKFLMSLQKRNPAHAIQKKFDKFIPLIKVMETATGQLVAAGRVTAEEVDRDNEICDYTKSKPMFTDWSQEQYNATSKAGQEPSWGNVRLQHSLQIAGRVIQPLDFDDTKKAISVATTPATGEIANWLRQGVLTGFSMGGSYAERKCNDCKTDIPGDGNFCPKCHHDVVVKFVARPSEISYVDRPALKSAHFSYVKADGTEEFRAFAEKADEPVVVEKAVKYLVTEADGTTHLPYTSDDGKPDHGLMGNAWAALHDGFRGNKYAGPDKQKAIDKLKGIYSSEGQDLPGKADVPSELCKAIQKIATYQEQRCAKIEAAMIGGIAGGDGVTSQTGYNFYDLRGKPARKLTQEEIDDLTPEELQELEDELERQDEEDSLLSADKVATLKAKITKTLYPPLGNGLGVPKAQTFDEVYAGLKEMDEFQELGNAFSEKINALTQSVWSILSDPAIRDKQSRINASVDDFVRSAKKSDLVSGMAKIACGMKAYSAKGGPGSGPQWGYREQATTAKQHSTAAYVATQGRAASSQRTAAEAARPGRAAEGRHRESAFVHESVAASHQGIAAKKVLKYSDAQPREGAGKWAEQAELESTADEASGDAEAKSQTARDSTDGPAKNRNHINAAVAHHEAAEAHARAGNPDKAREHASRAMAHYAQVGKLSKGEIMEKSEIESGLEKAASLLESYSERVAKSNPEGINQYTGGGGSGPHPGGGSNRAARFATLRAKESTNNAQFATAHANTWPGNRQDTATAYTAAANAHSQAAEDHRMASDKNQQAGNGQRAVYHNQTADLHREQAESLARTAQRWKG